MNIEDVEEREVMRKITEAKECFKIECFGVDAGEKRRKRRCSPERQRRSKAAHSQENRKAQQERGVVEGRSGEPSKC